MQGLCNRLRENIARLSAVTAQSVEEQQIIEEIKREFEEIALQVAWLQRGQRTLDERLERIEQSLLSRTIRWPGVQYARVRNLLGRWSKQSDAQYAKWVEYEQRSLLPHPEACRKEIGAFLKKPLITVATVIGASNARPKDTIQSVINQIYSSWELCICVNGLANPAIEAYLEELSRFGNAIRIIRSTSPLGPHAALDAACNLGTGEYVGLLHEGDLLSPYALFYVAQALQRLTPALLYSDEDRLSSAGCRLDPVFKPAWSPDLLRVEGYPANFLVSVRELMLNRADRQIADSYRRLNEEDDYIVHIPRILYHRRADEQYHPVKTGKPIPKPAVERTVSIIICSKSPKLLNNVLRSIRKSTTYPRYEVIVAEDCRAGENPEMARVAGLFDCQRISTSGPFNFSGMNNIASEQAKGDILLFLNDDVEALHGDWLSRMVVHLEARNVGIVGAKLLYPSGAIQHAGVVVGIGHGAGHVNRYKYNGVYWKWIDQARDVSAVTGACLAVQRELFKHLGGFDLSYPNNYNDVDLCLRVREAGYRVVYEPAAVLRHYEGQTRTLHVDYDERARFYTRWHRIIESGDPFYNPNLTPDEEGMLNFRAAQQCLDARRELM